MLLEPHLLDHGHDHEHLPLLLLEPLLLSLQPLPQLPLSLEGLSKCLTVVTRQQRVEEVAVRWRGEVPVIVIIARQVLQDRVVMMIEVVFFEL